MVLSGFHRFSLNYCFISQLQEAEQHSFLSTVAFKEKAAEQN